MLRSKSALITTMLTVILSFAGESAVAQQKNQSGKVNPSPAGKAKALGVQEVDLKSWRPQPQQFPTPKEVKVGLPPQVQLAPGPRKPGELPEQEDHQGVQVEMLNP
jgi:hypothetical protein